MTDEYQLAGKTAIKLGNRLAKKENEIARLKRRMKYLEEKITQLEWELGK